MGGHPDHPHPRKFDSPQEHLLWQACTTIRALKGVVGAADTLLNGFQKEVRAIIGQGRPALCLA